MWIDAAELEVSCAGRWRVSSNGAGERAVVVDFERVTDRSALLTRLEAWRTSVMSVLAAEADPRGTRGGTPLLPIRLQHDDTGDIRLILDAPVRTGGELLPRDASAEQVIDLLERVADALDTLHSRRFVHGALSRTSLWEMRDGSLRFPDAGLTVALDGVVPVPLESAAMLSPEVRRGHAAVAASDQYTLGVIAMEFLTHRTTLSEHEVAGNVLTVGAILPAHGEPIFPGAPLSLNGVIRRALSATPDTRYDSCREFVDRLRRALITGDEKVGVSVEEAAAVARRRATRVAVATAAVVVAGIGVAAVSMSSGVTQWAAGVAHGGQRALTSAHVPARVSQAVNEIVAEGRGVTSKLPSAARSDKPSTIGRAVDAVGKRLGGAGTTSVSDRASGGQHEALIEEAAAAKSGAALRAADAHTGLVHVEGPRGARYYVDGALVRPVRGNFAVGAGDHELLIVVPNRSSKRKRLIVRGGDTVNIGR